MNNYKTAPHGSPFPPPIKIHIAKDFANALTCLKDHLPIRCYFGISELHNENTNIAEYASPLNPVTMYNGMNLSKMLDVRLNDEIRPDFQTNFVLSDKVNPQIAFAICLLSGIFGSSKVKNRGKILRNKERLARMAQFLDSRRMGDLYDPKNWVEENQTFHDLDNFLKIIESKARNMSKGTYLSMGSTIPWNIVAEIFLDGIGNCRILKCLLRPARRASMVRKDFSPIAPTAKEKSSFLAGNFSRGISVEVKLFTDYTGSPFTLYTSRSDEITDFLSAHKSSALEVVISHNGYNNSIRIGLGNKEQAKFLPRGWQNELCKKLNLVCNKSTTKELELHTMNDGFGCPDIPHVIFGKRKYQYSEKLSEEIYKGVISFLKEKLQVIDVRVAM